jgi:hypothetical protein
VARKLRPILAWGIFLILTGCGKSPSLSRPTGVPITLSPDHSESLELTIPPGTTVTWSNQDDTDQSITSITGVWDSGRLRPGERFSYRFNEPGDYDYVSVFHPRLEGVIHVAEN